MSDMDEFKQTFFTECGELLVDMEARLMNLQVGVHDKEELNAIFRCAHSIKGGSGAFGMNAIMGFTHILEALLDMMREGKILPSREAIDMLLKSSDVVTKMLEGEKAGTPLPADFGADLAAALQNYTSGTPTASAPAPAKPAAPVAVAAPVLEDAEIQYEVSFKPHKEIFTTGNEPMLILRELAKLGTAEITTDFAEVPEIDALDVTECFFKWNIKLTGTIQEPAIWDAFEFVRDVADITVSNITPAIMVSPLETITEVAVVPPSAASHLSSDVKKPAVDEHPVKAVASAPSAAASIRVDLEKVDRLVNMVGELVITEAMLKSQARNLGTEQFSGLLRGIEELSHHTRELQEAVMAVRMQPVKSIFSRMPRIVRDTSAQLGKDIQLILSGENTEVDKTVIEQLGDPLTHMIRNSIDHGIEMPDQRIWNDKPLQGTIHLSAYHRSGRIIIEIQDDGAGINRDRVLAKAKEKGLIAPDAVLKPEEIDQLIFLPGFSTAEKVTSVSGRGVGMDVVRRNIEGIGGRVHITNNPGKGSIFTVSLPLTLAILDGMIVRVGKENYIVPITSIIETLRPGADQVKSVEGRGQVMNVRGEFVPLMFLNNIFGIKNAVTDPSKALIVLVEAGKQKMGLVVDELIGQQQVVLKSLAANADPVKGISGATILGDGHVSLILEINELKELSQKNPGQVKTVAA